jgi:hypothetical protein
MQSEVGGKYLRGWGNSDALAAALVFVLLAQGHAEARERTSSLGHMHLRSSGTLQEVAPRCRSYAKRREGDTAMFPKDLPALLRRLPVL